MRNARPYSSCFSRRRTASLAVAPGRITRRFCLLFSGKVEGCTSTATFALVDALKFDTEVVLENNAAEIRGQIFRNDEISL